MFNKFEIKAIEINCKLKVKSYKVTPSNKQKKLVVFKIEKDGLEYYTGRQFKEDNDNNILKAISHISEEIGYYESINEESYTKLLIPDIYDQVKRKELMAKDGDFGSLLRKYGERNIKEKLQEYIAKYIMANNPNRFKYIYKYCMNGFIDSLKSNKI